MMQLKVFPVVALNSKWAIFISSLMIYFKSIGSEKFGTFSFPSVAEQVKKLHHTRTHRQIDFEKLQQDHSGEYLKTVEQNIYLPSKPKYSLKTCEL